MLAMPGLRAFALAAKRGYDGVSCDADGVFVGSVPLLQPPSVGSPYWTARPGADLNKELTARYRLPIDIASKAGALALIAAALNHGDLAMAAIAAVQMQLPDPPSLAKRTESLDEITHRARELTRSGLLKFWDPALHPRAGVPPNPGWFAPADDDSERVEAIPTAAPNPSQVTLVGDKPKILEVIPDITIINPADKPWKEESEGEGEEEENEIGPPGVVELPLPGGSPGASGAAEAPKPSVPVDAQPSLPFPGGLPQQRAPGADTDVSGADNPTQVPARGGRLGNAATRAQNAEIAAALVERGYTITGGGGVAAEEYIPGGGPGNIGATYVDITAFNETTGKWLRVQTVDTLADGMTPDSRERAAIERIQKKFPNDELWIIPKR